MQNYIFKTQDDGSVIGGLPIKHVIQKLIKEDIGLSRFENLVIPTGLVLNSQNSQIFGGSSLIPKEYIQEGGMDENFDKLFDIIATTSNIRGGKTKKNREKHHNITKRS